MKYWEINRSLNNKLDGIKKYDEFEKTVCEIKAYFDTVFGVERMNKVLFYVDNAVLGSGHTPIVTVALGKIAIIKLNIQCNDTEAEVAYQFAHELTHVVFRAYFGMNKPHATDEEETICTAAALTVIKNMYPGYFDTYEQVTSEKEAKYRNGVPLAREISYDMEKIKYLIATFPGYENSNVETETDCLDSQ